MEDKLIVAVTAHPVLYDTSCLLYRDRYKKEQAWNKVSEVAGLPGKFCKYVFVACLQLLVSISIAPVSVAGFPGIKLLVY